MSVTNSLTSPVLEAPPEAVNRKLEGVKPALPFGDIALALSGGGFRAAAFSLGAISYLNRCWYASETDTLLKHVSFMTSTSGGTITNAYYGFCLFNPGFSFTAFYNNMKLFMQGDLVLQEAMEILNDPSKWDEVGFRDVEVDHRVERVVVEKTHNVINSFAKAYDNKLFNTGAPGENLYGVFFNRQQQPHLKTVCFNSTELNNGISFRFQTNGDPGSIFTVGNYYLQFKDADIAKLLKISDMVACSSCFPSGFEPVIYPNDFIHSGLKDAKQMSRALAYKNNNPLKIADVFEKPFCMVDGGVVDNQGLYSMMMEDNFRAAHPPKKQFDLMMVCDVGSYFTDAYKAPETGKGWWANLNIDKLGAVFPAGVILFIISLLLVSLTEGILHQAGLLFLLASGIYTAIYLYALLKIKGIKADLNQGSWGKVLNKYIGNFGKIAFGRLQPMLVARFKSTIMITTDLFLKQERRQYYNEFYNMPAYKDRVLSCFIYEFTPQHADNRLENLQTKDKAWWAAYADILQPSPGMIQVASDATAMATTLWFDEDVLEAQVTRDNIIACGQFTMCYNLIKHICRLEVIDSKWNSDPQLQALKKRLIEDWGIFCKNPGGMANDGINLV